MNSRTLLIITTISTLIFTGCQNNDLSAENQALKQHLTNLQQQVTELQQQNETLVQNNATIQTAENGDVTENVSSNTINNNSSDPSVAIYTLEELSAMTDEFVVSVGSVTPDINNSGNLDQFFSLKKEGDQIEHALENHENYLENQYRNAIITREEYKKADSEIEKLEELLDSASDRLEITFGIND